MALSNWDTLAVDLKGEPQAGCFVSPGGVRVEIYKNWIYVHDAKAWREGGPFVADTVMQISEGQVRYHDVHIRAIRGPQDGVYVVCWHENTETGRDDGVLNPLLTGMIGCGVSGFEGEKWVGVLPGSVQFLQRWISNKERTFTDEEIEEMLPDLDDKAKAEVREEFSFDFPEEIATVKLDRAIRFNQGDEYFADKIGTPLNATKPGESAKPILS